MKTIFLNRTFLGVRAIILIVLAVILMFVDHRSSALVQVNSTLSVVAAPFEYAVDYPIKFVNWLTTSFVSREALFQENQTLKIKVLTLQTKLTQFQALGVEDQQLKTLMQSAKYIYGKVLVAELIASDTAPYVHQLVINKGTQSGAYVGQPVLNARGVVGQIIQTSKNTSHILLITAANNAIPVEDVRNGLRAIAVGTGAVGQLKLVQIPKTTDIRVGDELFTSGLAGRYPIGYSVGVISNVQDLPGEAFTTITVKSTAAINRGRLLLLAWPSKPPISVSVIPSITGLFS